MTGPRKLQHDRALKAHHSELLQRAVRRLYQSQSQHSLTVLTANALSSYYNIYFLSYNPPGVGATLMSH